MPRKPRKGQFTSKTARKYGKKTQFSRKRQPAKRGRWWKGGAGMPSLRESLAMLARQARERRKAEAGNE